MREVQLEVRVLGGDAEKTYEALSDFERYPELTDAVRGVAVRECHGDTLLSEWEVNFRNGVLRWSERDELNRQDRTIGFDQLEGDFAHFSGTWRVEERPNGCTVRFFARFDLGMPSLAPMIDPIAETTLQENILRILDGLLEEDVAGVAAAGAAATGGS